MKGLNIKYRKKLTNVHAMWNPLHPKYMIYLYKAEVIVHY